MWCDLRVGSRRGVGSAGSSPWMTAVSWGKDIHPGVGTTIVIY